MKKYLFTISALFFAATILAQTNLSSTSPAVQSVVEKFTAKLNLDEEQVLKLVKIQQRRLRNLGEIANLKGANPEKYLQKRKSINKGTESSILRVLNEGQKKLYYEDRAAVQEKKAQKISELKSQGVTPKEMEPYLEDIEDEQY